MLKILQKIVVACDTINQWIGSVLVSAAVFFFIGIIFSNVVMRYVFNTSFVFMAELEWHVFCFIFLIGAGFTLLHDRHVRVDIFYSRMGEKQRALINCLGVLFLLIPSCFLVLHTSIPWVISAWQVGEVGLDPGGIPSRYIIKSALPIGYCLLLLQGIALFLRSLLILLGKGDSLQALPSAAQ